MPLNKTKTPTERLDIDFALKAARLGVWELDPVTNLFNWDDQCRELFGLTKNDPLLYEEVIPHIHADDVNRVNQAIEWVLKSQFGAEYDVTFRTLGIDDGVLRWVRLMGRSYFNEVGEVYRLAGVAQDVTLQVQQQEHLAASEQINQLATEAAGVASFYLRLADGHITYKPLLAKLLTGQEDTLFNRYTVARFIHPDDRHIRQQAYADGLLTSKVCYKIRFIWLDGSVHWIRTQGTYTFDDSGQPQALIGIVLDITEQVETQRQLEDSEAKMHRLIESVPFPIGVYVGPQMHIQFANQSIIDVWRKGKEVIGKPYAELLPELANQDIFAQLDDVYTTGIPFHARNQRVNIVVDGILQPYYFKYSFTPLYDADGQVYGVMNTAADVTDLVLAKQQVDESEATLQDAIELAKLATWSMDIDTGTFHYSARFMQWLGFSHSTKRLDEAFNTLPDEYRQSVADAIATAIRPGSSGLYENEHPIINWLTGQQRIIHVQARVFHDAAGKPAVLRGIAQDITEQRNIQLALEHQVQERTEELETTNEELAAINEEYVSTNEELAAANEEYAVINEELEESNQLFNRSNQNLEQFAYVASHDLQEPLRKIQQFGDLLKNQYADQLGEGVNYLERMQTAASRMSTLIRDLLSFSRISTRQDAILSTSLTDVVHNVLNDLDLRIRETGAVVEVESLPRIQGDRSQLEQLFLNLLSNALKFRRTDEFGVPVPPEIQISSQVTPVADLPPSVQPTRTAKSYHRIDVSDNGIGFDEKYVDRIFQVFQRLHGKSEFAGTGIGLAICEKVVANHGGAITASSQLGYGATFSIYLPVA
ncbi:PAS domain-containing protein [Spirosoma flavum]|uniref:histidine kinase n=1 Tax=Spirosoma flavum TaxID=2048557 RepID=A0ABW6AF01_9BACT